MPRLKLTDVTRSASLLKKLVEKADTNKDGAVRSGEVAALSPNQTRGNPAPPQLQLRSAIDGARRFAMSKGSVEVPDIQKAVDEIARRVKAADKDGDGFLSDAEQNALDTVAAKRFVAFAAEHKNSKVGDFTFAPQRTPRPPPFSWAGTPSQVCSSLLNAFSDRKNDNFWPDWGSPTKGASRYVLSKAEAQKMVTALTPLYASRQKAVVAELAARSAKSEFGCVSFDAGARAVFTAYAAQLGVQGLKFESPGAPKMPSPS